MAMAGSIRRRGSSYRIRYEGPPAADGRRKQVHETVHGTRRDAERLLRQRLQEVEQGSFVSRSDVTVRQYLENWLETYGQTNLEPSTVRGYTEKFHSYIFETIGGVRLTDLRPEHVDQVYAGMMGRGLSAQTVLHTHRALNRALVLAVRSRRISHNPLSMVTPPRVRKTSPPMWSIDQMRTFLAAAGAEDLREWFELALYTGLRRSEMAGLKWENVDLGAGLLRVVAKRVVVPRVGPVVGTPKTDRSRRRLSLSPEAVAIFHRQRDRQDVQRAQAGELWQDTGYVFTNGVGDPVDPGIATKAFTRIVRQTGLPKMTLRDMRHAHATLLLLDNVHLKVVSERLGHSTVTVTADIYSHVLPEMDQEASRVIDRMLGN